MRHAVFSILLLLAAPLDAQVTHSVGIARDATSQNLRYIEHHQYTPDGRHLVDYYTPALERFAYKRLRYPTLPQHPEIEQEDFSRGSYTRVDVSGNEIRMLRRTEEETSTGVLPADEDLVVDAGFDAFIKANWITLLGEEDKDFKFAVAGLPRTLSMRVNRLNQDQDKHIAFRVHPRNWFIRMFLPSLDLWYTDERQLLRYDGYSNLLPKEGEGKQVIIDFKHYKTDSVLEAPMQAWLAQLAN